MMTEAPIQSQKLLKGFELLKKKDLEGARKIFEDGLSESEMAGDKVLKALFHSALGVMFKLKKEFRSAWKQYEKAEKLMPEDPSLKIISARLLVDYFGQYDIVIKKMDKVLEATKEFIPFHYQAHTITGLAYLRMGDKQKAAESLRSSMDDLKKGLETIANIDFELVEALSRKGIAPALCIEFLHAARDLAKQHKESVMEKFIQKLIDHFPHKTA